MPTRKLISFGWALKRLLRSQRNGRSKSHSPAFRCASCGLLSTKNPKRFMKLLINEVRESSIGKDCYNQVIWKKFWLETKCAKTCRA
jgi:hypothetical protein